MSTEDRVLEIGISSIGTAVPAFSYSQKEIVEFIAQALALSSTEKRRILAIYQATGIEKRHTVLDDHLRKKGDYRFFPNHAEENLPPTKKRMDLYQANALPLAIKAIHACFETRKVPDITHLITVSCTGMYAPGLDIDLIKHFNLATTTHRIAINFMGCYGAFNALKTAHALCKANKQAKVLIVCLELCSLHYQRPQTQDNIVSSALFSDGAAAVLIESQLNQGYLRLNDFYCDLIPDSHHAMAWSISDQGFDIVLSSYVPSLVELGIANFFKQFLATQSLDLDTVQQYAIHPGGIKILQACEKALGISEYANRFAYEIFRQYGNMSSATILFVLKKIWETLKPDSNEENILCCAFGPGLTLEGMLIQNVNL